VLVLVVVSENVIKEGMSCNLRRVSVALSVS
jgi:hypothetical protein